MNPHGVVEYRPMTEREQAVLDVMLSVEFDGVERLRSQAASARVARTCPCGCPSIDFEHPPTAPGMRIQVNASVAGTLAGMFLFTEDGWLGGIEWLGDSEENPAELPHPSVLTVGVAD